MSLTEHDRQRYHEQGFLLAPGLLSSREVEILDAARERLLTQDGPHVRRDAQGGPPQIVYAPHALSEAFATLTRLPRILASVETLLGERAYVYQSRINLKLPFTSDAWSWHQDFPAWHRGDGMPTPRAVMVAIFLHECTVAGGPLLVIPRSHREDLAEVLAREANVTGYKVQRVATETLARLAEQGGIADLCGPAGSVAFIHPTLLHGSAPNMSPWPRSIYYVNFNAVTNATLANSRAWFMNNTDNTPLETLEDGALLALAQHAPRAEVPA